MHNKVGIHIEIRSTIYKSDGFCIQNHGICTENQCTHARSSMGLSVSAPLAAAWPLHHLGRPCVVLVHGERERQVGDGVLVADPHPRVRRQRLEIGLDGRPHLFGLALEQPAAAGDEQSVAGENAARLGALAWTLKQSEPRVCPGVARQVMLSVPSAMVSP